MADNLPIGTVLYSILEPNVFKEVYGHEAWVLFDDRDIKDSELSTLTSISKLPDARGVFIRGMNATRSKENGDTNGDRPIGEYQSDMVGPHVHTIPNITFQKAPNGNLMGDGAAELYPVLNLQTAINNGLETRPRNIALYTYIKINNQ